MAKTNSKTIEAERDLLFGVRRSVRYHNRRRAFFDRLHIVTSTVSVVFGSATVFILFSNLNPLFAAIAATIVTMFSAIDLVIGTATRARLHSDLSRRFIGLEKEIISAGNLNKKEVDSFTAQRLEMEADEPPVLRVLDSICHNELMRAMGHKKEKLLKIKWYQRLFAPLMDIREHAIH